LLCNANPPTVPALIFSFQGNQLTVQRSTSLKGVFYITMMVGAGVTTAQRVIAIKLN
jgi:hypothetical protein